MTELDNATQVAFKPFDPRLKAIATPTKAVRGVGKHEEFL
jgi:hypothetical protein